MVTYSNVIKTEMASTDEGKSLLQSLIAFITESGQELPSELNELIELLPKKEESTASDIAESNDNGEGREEVDGEEGGEVSLVVPTDNELEQKGSYLLEQTVLDAILKVEKSVIAHQETDEAINEEDGLFQMDSGSPGKGSETLEVKDSLLLNQLDSSEERLSSGVSPSQIVTNSQSLTTPTLVSTPPKNQHIGVSLPSSLSSQELIPSIPPPPTQSIPLSPPTSVIYPTEQVPLSIRMAGGRSLSEEHDEVSVVSRPKKKKKPTSKRRKSVQS